MIVLGLDTATPSTVAAVLLETGAVTEARDDPPPGTRPAHAGTLLALAEEAIGAAGVAWADVERIAVGVGPGGFTGLRIGIATARGLAQARGIPLAGVSSLRALAAAAPPGDVAAVIDARRGEVFAAAWDARGEPLLAPAAYAPEDLAERLTARPGTRAVGDGAVRFRAQLEAAGARVPPDGSPLHRIAGEWICRLGAAAEPTPRDALLPDYRREPDARPPSTPQ